MPFEVDATPRELGLEGPLFEDDAAERPAASTSQVRLRIAHDALRARLRTIGAAHDGRGLRSVEPARRDTAPVGDTAAGASAATTATAWTAVILDDGGVFDPDVEEALTHAGIRIVGRARTAPGALSLLGRRMPHSLVCLGGSGSSPWLDSAFLRRAYAVDRNLRSIMLGDAPPPIEAALSSLPMRRGDRAAVIESQASGTSAEQPLLTRREREVLALAAEGNSNSQIARALWVTRDTVKFHLANIYRKLAVSDRAEAARIAAARGILDPAPISLPVTEST